MPDKTNPSHSNPPITLDLRSLLALPNEAFLPSAFAALMGREPDVVGLTHYALRLQRGANRVLILAEMRTSPEGRRHAPYANSDELELLVRRYQKIRSLPLGRWRWNLLPQFGREPPKDHFDWERWATDYADWKSRTSAPTASASKPPISTNDAPNNNPSEQNFIALEQRVEALSAALQQVSSLIQEQEISTRSEDTAYAPPEIPPQGCSAISMSEVSWAARSLYVQLYHKMRAS